MEALIDGEDVAVREIACRQSFPNEQERSAKTLRNGIRLFIKEHLRKAKLVHDQGVMVTVLRRSYRPIFLRFHVNRLSCGLSEVYSCICSPYYATEIISQFLSPQCEVRFGRENRGPALYICEFKISTPQKLSAGFRLARRNDEKQNTSDVNIRGV